MRYRRMQEREDRRAALAAWAQIELNRDREKRSQAFTIEEIVSWLGHGFQRDKASEPAPEPTTEDLMAKAHAFMQLYGQTKVNGQQGPDHA